MLIDIDALDSSDLKAWTLEHIGIPTPKNIISPRIERFSQAFEAMFEDLHFYKVDNISNTKTILFKRKNAEIPIYRLSSGEKQIVYRGAFFLKDIKLDIGNLVFIDEPEISLHPEWQKKILGYYQKLFSDEKGKQLSQMFVATHSPFIIHNPNRHNDKVVVLQKDEGGNSIQSDKPEYYDCNSCKAVEDSFSVSDFDSNEKILFIEDGAHKTILEELLKNEDFKIVPIGTCDKVLACSEALNDKDNFFFLVDGDRKIGLDTTKKKYAKHTHRLHKYCIENYLFDRAVLNQVILSLSKSTTPENLIQKVVDTYNPSDTKFDRIKTLFECGQFSFEKLDDTDCSELIKRLGSNDFLNKKQYDLICLFIQKAKELGKFEELFTEVLNFLEVKRD